MILYCSLILVHKSFCLKNIPLKFVQEEWPIATGSHEMEDEEEEEEEVEDEEEEYGDGQQEYQGQEREEIQVKCQKRENDSFDIGDILTMIVMLSI